MIHRPLLAAVATAACISSVSASVTTAVATASGSYFFVAATAAAPIAFCRESTCPVMSPAPWSAGFRDPSLSRAGNKLAILDRDTSQLLLYDPAVDSIPVCELRTPELHSASEVAISDNYIAAALPDRGEIILFGRRTAKIDDRLTIPPSTHIRLRALSQDRFAILIGSQAPIQEIDKHQGAWAIKLAISFHLQEYNDFDEDAGVFYGLDGNDLTVVSRDSALPPRRIHVGAYNSVDVAANDIVLWKSLSPHFIERLVPIVASLEDPNGRNMPAFLDIYDYLAKAGLTRKFVLAASQQTTLSQLLSFTTHSSVLTDTFISRQAADHIANTLCALNAVPCQDQASLLKWLRSSNTLSIIVPALDIQVQPVRRQINLGKQTWSSYVASLPAELRADTSISDTLRANPTRAASFDYQLLVHGFVPVDYVLPALRPAFILDERGARRFNDDCELDRSQPLTAEPLVIPPNLESTLIGVLPGDGQRPSIRKLRSFGVKTLRLRYDAAVVEKVPQDYVLRFQDTPACIQLLQSNNLVVASALRLDNPAFQLLDDDGQLLNVSPQDITDLGLRVSLQNNWLVSNISPLYVGYTVWRFEAATGHTPSLRKFDDISVIDDLLAGGTLNAPIPAWNVATYAFARDIRDEKSTLYSAERTADTALILPAQELSNHPQSFAVDDIPSNIDTGGELLRKNRSELLTAISYPAKPLSDADVIIGLVESCKSTDFLHPDFRADGTNAWIQDSTTACTEAWPQEQPARISDAWDLDQDHGTYIAGLLAARNGSPVKGLLPSAKLYFIPRDNDWVLTNFAALVDQAGRFGASIFNLSLTWSSPADNPRIRKRFRLWPDYLFIAASGNKQAPVRDSDDAPASWSPQSETVLVVGASNRSHSRFVTGQGNGTSFGADAVDLFALGEDIYSTKSGGGYTHASGSSVAVAEVTAAAALLRQTIGSPRLIKARLLYTADWHSGLGDDVWAGELNAERALDAPLDSHITTQTAPDKYQHADFRAGDEFTISGPDRKIKERMPPNELPVIQVPPTLKMQDVLRVSLQPDGTFRIFYRDPFSAVMRIIENAVISDLINCRDPSDAVCDMDGKFDVAQIKDYYAGVPIHDVTIRFK